MGLESLVRCRGQRSFGYFEPHSLEPRCRASNKERDQRLALLGVIVKLGLVPLVVLDRAGSNVAPDADGERTCREVPAGDRKARPLQAFPKEVGAGHVVKHAALWDLVACLSRLAQVCEDVVCMNVDCHAGKEEWHADEEARVGEPFFAVGVENCECPRLQPAVGDAKAEGHEEDRDGGGLAAADTQGEDEGAVEIVGAKQADKNLIR
mmetsp:Transcript_9447/g.27597  ORF Transcript_9447/g.27597 Transcript_9447/m.27597 type:complete len:208 (-) Transcript_9447:346-969(-)